MSYILKKPVPLRKAPDFVDDRHVNIRVFGSTLIDYNADKDIHQTAYNRPAALILRNSHVGAPNIAQRFCLGPAENYVAEIIGSRALPRHLRIASSGTVSKYDSGRLIFRLQNDRGIHISALRLIDESNAVTNKTAAQITGRILLGEDAGISVLASQIQPFPYDLLYTAARESNILYGFDVTQINTEPATRCDIPGCTFGSILIEADRHLLPALHDSYDLGLRTRQWRNIHGTSIYQDGKKVITEPEIINIFNYYFGPIVPIPPIPPLPGLPKPNPEGPGRERVADETIPFGQNIISWEAVRNRPVIEPYKHPHEEYLPPDIEVFPLEMYTEPEEQLLPDGLDVQEIEYEQPVIPHEQLLPDGFEPILFPLEFTVEWESITNKPETFPPEEHRHDWDEIDNKPLRFPPEDHRHEWTEIDNIPTDFPPEDHFHIWEEVRQQPSFASAGNVLLGDINNGVSLYQNIDTPPRLQLNNYYVNRRGIDAGTTMEGELYIRPPRRIDLIAAGGGIEVKENKPGIYLTSYYADDVPMTMSLPPLPSDPVNYANHNATIQINVTNVSDLDASRPKLIFSREQLAAETLLGNRDDYKQCEIAWIKTNYNGAVPEGLLEINQRASAKNIHNESISRVVTEDYFRWGNIPDPPEKFPQEDHTHIKANITDFAHTHVKADITEFAHTHIKADITDFAHTHVKADITDFAHTHTKANITDFAHTHVKADITDFAHTHLKADITDFAHTHVKADITDFAHTHVKADITDFAHIHTKADISDFAHRHNWDEIDLQPTFASTGNVLTDGTNGVSLYQNINTPARLLLSSYYVNRKGIDAGTTMEGELYIRPPTRTTLVAAGGDALIDTKPGIYLTSYYDNEIPLTAGLPPLPSDPAAYDDKDATIQINVTDVSATDASRPKLIFTRSKFDYAPLAGQPTDDHGKCEIAWIKTTSGGALEVNQRMAAKNLHNTTLSGVVTDDYLTNKGYLTSADLSSYATDAELAAALANYLPLTGGTVTGTVNATTLQIGGNTIPKGFEFDQLDSVSTDRSANNWTVNWTGHRTGLTGCYTTPENDADSSGCWMRWTIPEGMKSFYIQLLVWGNCRYFDIYGETVNGHQHFLRRVNNYQAIQNTAIQDGTYPGIVFTSINCDFYKR